MGCILTYESLVSLVSLSYISRALNSPLFLPLLPLLAVSGRERRSSSCGGLCTGRHRLQQRLQSGRADGIRGIVLWLLFSDLLSPMPKVFFPSLLLYNSQAARVRAGLISSANPGSAAGAAPPSTDPRAGSARGAGAAAAQEGDAGSPGGLGMGPLYSLSGVLSAMTR